MDKESFAKMMEQIARASGKSNVIDTGRVMAVGM
jgi:hypothetical protein